MASRQEQARLFNEAIAQGLTEDQALAAAGITAHAVFTLTEILEALTAAGRLSAQKRAEVLAFIAA